MGLHLRNLIHTWTWFRCWDSGLWVDIENFEVFGGSKCICLEGQRMDYWESLRQRPKNPRLLGCTLLCSLSLLSIVWVYWLTSNKQNTAEVIGCQFWDEFIKSCCSHLGGSLTVFWMAQCGKSQLPCHEAACGEFHASELESGPSEACQLASEWAWKQILSRQSLRWLQPQPKPWW